ncbi:WD40 repeat-like protein [Xylariaceae sp. FL0594]|nr:WD40 repeat-like protein [Xylariaceae sp. FL0594]
MDDFDPDANGSSENEHEQDDDLTMNDVDAEDNDHADQDEEDENDNDNDNDEPNDNENENEDDEEDDQEQESQHQGQQPAQSPETTSRKSASPSDQPTPKWRPHIRPEVLTAKTYDIVPTMAAPMATSINAMAITPDLRYWMTGGSDGYIRKYDGPATINGKTLLTVAQRHPFVDSVTKAGVLMSYWENAEPQPASARQEDIVLSPVYSLAVHSQALWLLSGLESGGINLQSVRHDEGKRIACLQKHTNAVSALTLAVDEKSVLSGSWDKKIFDWDLNTGAVSRQFDGNGAQISAIELRPMNGAPIPPEASEEALPSDTFYSNNGYPTTAHNLDFKLEGGLNSNYSADLNGGLDVNGHPMPHGDAPPGLGDGDGANSPAHDSLFGGSPGGNSDLFGDNDGMGGFGGDDDNEFSRAIIEDSAQDNMPVNDYNTTENNNFDPQSGAAPEVGPTPPGSQQQQQQQQQGANGPVDSTMDTSMGGLEAVNGTEASAMDNNTTQATLMPTADANEYNNNNTSTNTNNDSFSTSFQPNDGTQINTTLPASQQPQQDGEAPTAPSPPATTLPFAAPPTTLHDPSQTSDSTFLSASIDGPIRIWDRRMPNPVARIGNRTGVPPWCMGACWSPDGNWIYAGRRNGTVEEFSIAKARGGRAGWQPERVLKFPAGSGPVSCVRPMPNGRHLVCASHDILRLYDLRADAAGGGSGGGGRQKGRHGSAPPPFLIVPGPPRAGVISSLYIDASSRFMISAAGNRGWEGTCTEVLIGYEINVP